MTRRIQDVLRSGGVEIFAVYQIFNFRMTRLNDLRQLRAFVQVCDSGSISAAARVLGVPQPTVSRQLQGLEKVLGLPLVRRDTHNLSLTEAGRTLLPDAKRMLEISDRVGQSLTDSRIIFRVICALFQWWISGNGSRPGFWRNFVRSIPQSPPSSILSIVPRISSKKDLIVDC